MILFLLPLRFKYLFNVPFGVTYEKSGTIQRRLAWPLHKDDTLPQSGRTSVQNICFFGSEYRLTAGSCLNCLALHMLSL
ncbi:hypothetical protein C8R42DRAFT_660152 [Lentinula raphanica]|nr:hypothetical protein C8R42DRAFT_660152 [Lentinula raphanica]